MASSDLTPIGANSVTRLMAKWVNTKGNLDPIEYLSGTYQPGEGESFFIHGQGDGIEFRSGAQNLSPGNHVCVSFKKENAQFKDDRIQILKAESFLEISKLKTMDSSFTPTQAKQWSKFIRQVEVNLEARGLLAVQTPTLVVNPGMETELNSMSSLWTLGSRKVQFYLPTSPELHLKRFLCQGFTDIYEIKTCFRDDELSEYHEAEFHMLEWYRAYADLNLIEEDLLGLIRELLPKIEITRKSMSDLFTEYLGAELLPDTTLAQLKQIADHHKIICSATDSWNDLFFRIYVEKIEPHLKKYAALILTDYPPSMAALAKLNATGFADRMELYLSGVEIANAFNELTDPQEQRQRFEFQQKERADLGKPVLPIDENFMGALESGMPPSGGIALGLDRLFMAIYGLKTIQETRAFPMRDELKGFQ